MTDSAQHSSTIRERLLRQAIAEFAQRDLHEVKVTEIARPLGLASQAVYRYFKNREELFEAALELDYSELIQDVLEAVADNPLPLLTGAAWYAFMEKLPNHPLIRKVFIERDAYRLRKLHDCAATEEFAVRAIEELQAAQRAGIVREDIDVELMLRSMTSIRLQMVLPLLAEGKYLTPEWNEITALSLAAYFHPILDVTTPDSAAAVEKKFTMLAASMASEYSSKHN